MRALVSLVVVALVGFAVTAHSAAAGSGSPKKPDGSMSVNLGPASATADASTDGAGVDVSPSTPVEATASTETGVSATVDASTPVGEASVQASASTADATGVPAQIHAKTSTPLGSATARAGSKKSLDASVKVKTPAATGGTALSTGSGHAAGISSTVRRAVLDASSVPSNEGSPGVARPARAGAAAHARLAVPPPVRHRGRAHPSPQAKTLLNEPDSHALRASASLPGVTKAGTGHGVGVVTDTPVTASARRASESGSAPASPGNALGSGLSAAAFFAILSALLMLAAPLFGRWLRPAIGLALQPAFASLPERPG